LVRGISSTNPFLIIIPSIIDFHQLSPYIFDELIFLRCFLFISLRISLINVRFCTVFKDVNMRKRTKAEYIDRGLI